MLLPRDNFAVGAYLLIGGVLTHAYQLGQADPSRWLEMHGQALYTYAFSRVRRNEVAEDLVQETFLAALRGVRDFEGRSQERTWLIGILRHKMLDHFRKLKRINEVQPLEGGDAKRLMSLLDQPGRAPRPGKWGSDPATICEDKEFWRIYYDICKTKLPKTVGEAYILRELEGLSVENVCEVLDISSKKLAVRIHRARQALRDCLEEQWFDQRPNKS